ncbi:MAG: polymorphic toxin-type HINT domain-containing protein [Zavarzinella sp.]
MTTRNLITQLNVQCDTPLRTPTGSMRADEIAIGDLLLSQDEFDPNGGIEAKAVEEVFIHVAPILNLHVGGRIICTTAEHPFYEKDQVWVPAKFLQPGDLLQSEEQQYLPVEGVADSGEVETVYNFRISDYHTYFVGDPTLGLERLGPQSMRYSKTGHTGERAARAVLRKGGHKILGSLQNNSGHGIDLVTKKNGKYYFWEAKGSTANNFSLSRHKQKVDNIL